jgi:hypothetical protein
MMDKGADGSVFARVVPVWTGLPQMRYNLTNWLIT